MAQETIYQNFSINMNRKQLLPDGSTMPAVKNEWLQNSSHPNPSAEALIEAFLSSQMSNVANLWH